ncbi:MAG: hypothetical protein LCH86_24010 [Proteobacteria bacterium]|nr:hypothetical protein [Pseudomonadota bacterium]
MATEFDNALHWGLFLTGTTLTSETGKYVRVSELVLSALRATGVFSNMVDGIVAPDTDRLWLDKNFDPAVLKEWDATGASWVPMTYGRLFGRAAIGKLAVTGGTGNAVVVSQPTGFQAARLYLMTPLADNSGATTINVSGVGSYPVKYGDGADLSAVELKSGRQAVLFFTGTRFEVLFPLALMSAAVVAAQASADAAAASALLSQKYAANPEDVEVEPGLYSSRHYLAKVVAYWSIITNTLGGWIHGAAVKATLVDADEIVVSDSTAAWVAKKFTWANLKTNIQTALGPLIAGTPAKMSLADADTLVIGDSAASNASKSVTVDIARKELAKGRQTLLIRADEFLPTIANGAALGIRAVATSNVPLATMNFDTTAQEYARAPLALPKKWNKGTITAEVVWTGAAAGSGGVTFSVGVCAWSDGDSLQTIGGAPASSADTYLGADLLHVSPVTTNITVGQMPVDGDLLYVLLSRLVSDANDTLAQDAQVVAVRIFYNVTTSNDA